MRPLAFVYIIEKVAHAHAQNSPLEWFSSTPRSRALAVERDMLLAYPVIDIHAITDFHFYSVFCYNEPKSLSFGC